MISLTDLGVELSNKEENFTNDSLTELQSKMQKIFIQNNQNSTSQWL